jgi:vacuolar-type H+-ATPase subunit I/STV1
MLLSMAKVQIIGTKNIRPQTIQTLHRLGLLQIIDWPEQARFEKSGLLEQEAALLRDKLALRLTHTQAVLSALPNLSPTLPPEYDDYAARPAPGFLRPPGPI